MRVAREERVREAPSLFREYVYLQRKQQQAGALSVAEFQRFAALKRELSRNFQPGLKDEHADARESVRVPIRVKVGFASYGELCESLMTNLSRAGIFIATPTPLEIGSVLQMRIHIEEEGQDLEVEGEVVSQNVGPGMDPRERGMGVRFRNLEPEQQALIDRLHRRALERAMEARGEDART
jgi:uncharacterized protein (TIGR02266 family)